MKRYGAIILTVLFVLGLAASAFAIHAEIPAETQAVVAKGQTQITIGGDIRFRGTFDKNLSDQLDDGTDDHVAYIDQRVRLKLDIKVTDNTSARIHLEHGSTWGEGMKDNAKGAYPVGNYYENDELKFVEAWINHNFGSFGIKLGHMPLALGNKLFFDHTKEGDDAIVIYGSTSNIHWAGVIAKFNEGEKNLNDDSTAYVFLANYKGDGFNLGGDVVYVDHQNIRLDLDGDTVPDVENIHGWNFGLRGDTTFAGLKVKADVELQAGKFEMLSGDDLDIKGYAFLVAADYDMDGTTIGAEFVYGSGDEDPNDTDVETFVTSLSQVQYGPYIYGYKSAATACDLPTCTGQTGIANTWWIALKGSTKLSKDLSLKGAIYYLQASEDVSINGANKDSDLGVEVDAKVTYKLDRNLKYWVEGGYFFTGDAYDYPDQSADDMYSIRNGIQLSF